MGYKVIGGGSSGGGGGPAFTDAFSLGIKATDTNAAPTDAATFLINLAESDTVAAQSETATLAFPAPDFADTSAAPTDANSFKLRVWLSGSAGTGVTNPANANGPNDGSVATLQTAAAGTNPITMTSALGSGVPSGISITGAIYRGWFKSVNTLTTSTGSITMHSTSALFADLTMFTNSSLNTTIDHLSGDFTVDLISLGVDTLAKLQSCQVLSKVQDAVAGVNPHVLTVDSGAIEINAAFT